MKNKTKLLLLNDWMYGGGAEKSMAILANELAATGKYDITLLMLENKLSFDLHESIKVKSFRDNYLFGVFGKLMTLFLDVFRLVNLIKSSNINVVLSFQHRSNLVNVMSKLMYENYKCIISERVYTKDFFQDRGINKLFFNFMIKQFYKRADVITCNAKDIKHGLNEFYNCSLAKIKVIENAYDTEKIKTLGNEPLDEVDSELFNGKKIIINVGRLEKQKGQEYLIRAFNLLENKNSYRLIILGDGPLNKYLNDLIFELNLQEYVFLIGHKINPYKYLKNADIFVFPSLYEGYPNALAEAMIFDNLKIISFDFKSGAKDLLGDNEYGCLVKIGDIYDLKEKIESETVHHKKKLNSLEVLLNEYKQIIG
ncbi:glycosyltransferase [Aliarcobacter butzleri]|uniref:glycosyltransferase n=1 Tax=Aliarcobacter butzleri TaxID=28197 RepID=UPI00344C27F6